MGNKRTDIRTNLKTLLETEFPTVQVFTSRRSNISQDEELTSITIHTPNESATPESLHRNRYIRKTELRLEVRLAGSGTTDNDLDNFLSEIEDLMIENQSILGQVLGSVLINTETDIGADASLEIGFATLIYELTYVS